jgi:hypothetical protein
VISIGCIGGSTTPQESPIVGAMQPSKKKRPESPAATTQSIESDTIAPGHARAVCDSATLATQGHLRPSTINGEAGSLACPRPTQAGFIEMLGELVGPDDIIEAGRRLGAIKRQRKTDLPALVQATVAAMSPIPGAETSAFVNYLSITGVPMVPSSFYDRFTPAFAGLMRDLARKSIEMVRAVSPTDACIHDYGVLFERFDDVQAADASAFMLKRLAQGWAPSTSKKRPAGIKINTVMSLRDHLPTAIDVTTQRRHDNAALPEDALRPGTLTFFDLGYLDLARFVSMTKAEAFFLTRLKASHNPVIHRVWIGGGERKRARGMRLDDALEQCALEFHRELGVDAVDIDVVLDDGKEQVIGRVVGIQSEAGERWWYVTNVDREVLPAADVGVAYTLRWDIELLFKQLKSGAGLSAVLAWRSSAVLAFLYAKITALSLARLLELSVAEKMGVYATTQLALLLTLSRSVPLLLGIFMQQRGVTVAQMHDRIIMIAGIVARSRRQRRERTKRERRQGVGR